jgi:hypothetical protein
MTELLVSVLYYVFQQRETVFHTIYHIYLPIEYTFLAYFFYLVNQESKIRHFALISIPVFIIFSLIVSVFSSYFRQYPGMNANAEGVLLILWSLYTLFSLNPNENFKIPILQLPLFWICMGILVFHSGTFFYNGLINSILDKQPDLVKFLNYAIAKALNYFLYISFSIGFLYSNKWQKYI